MEIDENYSLHIIWYYTLNDSNYFQLKIQIHNKTKLLFDLKVLISIILAIFIDNYYISKKIWIYLRSGMMFFRIFGLKEFIKDHRHLPLYSDIDLHKLGYCLYIKREIK